MTFKGRAHLGIEMALVNLGIVNLCNKFADIESCAVRRLPKSTVTELLGIDGAFEIMAALFVNGNNRALALNPGNLTLGDSTALVENERNFNIAL